MTALYKNVLLILGETGFIKLEKVRNDIIETSQRISNLKFDVISYPPVSYKL